MFYVYLYTIMLACRLNIFFFSVVMHKDKEENSGLHRQRDLTAFDHTPLDGEMFLQVPM